MLPELPYSGIVRDATFGLTPRFFRKRGIFKKVRPTRFDRFNIPVVEASTLDLRIEQAINVLGIRLDTNELIKIPNIQVTGEDRRRVGFNVPRAIRDKYNIDATDSIPTQFVVAPVGINDPNPINQVSQLRDRRNYTAADFMVWKQMVKRDQENNTYVTIEPNEREYFNVEEGDKLSITLIGLESEGLGSNIKRFFNESARTTVRYSQSDSTSARVYVGSLIDRFQYNEGDIVQCIGTKL